MKRLAGECAISRKIGVFALQNRGTKRPRDPMQSRSKLSRSNWYKFEKLGDLLRGKLLRDQGVHQGVQRKRAPEGAPLIIKDQEGSFIIRQGLAYEMLPRLSLLHHPHVVEDVVDLVPLPDDVVVVYVFTV